MQFDDLTRQRNCCCVALQSGCTIVEGVLTFATLARQALISEQTVQLVAQAVSNDHERAHAH